MDVEIKRFERNEGNSKKLSIVIICHKSNNYIEIPINHLKEFSLKFNEEKECIENDGL